jgi:hypothetical protein
VVYGQEFFEWVDGEYQINSEEEEAGVLCSSDDFPINETISEQIGIEKSYCIPDEVNNFYLSG